MDLEKLMEYADRLSIEFTESMSDFNTKWSGKRQAAYSSGPIRGMYEDNDYMLMEAMSNTPDIDRLKYLLLLCIKTVSAESQRHMRHIEYSASFSPGNYTLKGADGRAYTYLIRDHTDDVSRATNFEELKNAVDNYNGHYLETVANEPIERQMMYLQICLEYDKHKDDVALTSMFAIEQPELDSLYKSIFSKESEFKTYGLIPIDMSRELMVMVPPRIYDRDLNKTIILSLDKPLVEDIKNLYDQNLIGSMSFRASGKIHEGLYETQSFLEEVERGCKFNYRLEELDDITKLYSKDYNDQLWIRKDGVNIYFEELDSDFDSYEDYVVTRLLHIEFEKGNEYQNKSIVRHMDFEYIFYTLEEFEQRKINGYIKGSRKKKLFKLDNCRIPIDYKVKMVVPDYSDVDVLFIVSVIQAFFEHRHLIDEYFAGIGNLQ